MDHRKGSWLTCRIPKHHPHAAQAQKQIMAREPKRNLEEHREMENLSRQLAQCSCEEHSRMVSFKTKVLVFL